MQNFTLVIDGTTRFEYCLTVVNQLRSCIDRELNLQINLKLLKHAKIELLTVVISGILDLKLTKTIHIDIIPSDDNDVNRYISRINFYKLLSIHNPENFNRYDTSGSLIEIKELTKENRDAISTELAVIFDRMEGVDLSIKEILLFCITEIIDNIDRHSRTNCNGLIGAQVIKDRINLVIIDNGIGIRAALSTKPTGEYQNLSNKGALEICTDYGVSSTSGGKGLYFISKFVVHNGGVMHISSGENLKVITSGQRVLSYPTWKGTYIYLSLDKNKIVDHKKIFADRGLNHDIGETLQITLGKESEDENELW
jgi:hypothetical protein